MSTSIVRPGELRVMGESDSLTLVKFTKTGAIRALRTKIRLNPREKHVYELNGQVLVSAAGYNYLNQAVGVSRFIPPTTIGMDGETHRNPHIISDDNDDVQKVRIRCIGIGRNAVGNWVAIDNTLDYDLAPIISDDAWKKWRPHSKHKEKDWGKLYDCMSKVPDDVRNDPFTRCLTVSGGYVLAMKLAGEVLDIARADSNRRRFASIKATTIVWRNILKTFMGISVLDPAKDGWVSVIAWPQVDRDAIHEIQEMVQRAEDGVVDIDGKPVLISKLSTVVDSVDAERELLAGEADEDGDSSFDPPPLDFGELKSKIVSQYCKLVQDDAKQSLSSCGFSSLDDVNRCDDGAKLDRLMETLTERAVVDVG